MNQTASSPSSLILSKLRLGIDREVSTIPRAIPSELSGPPSDRPANNEAESGQDKKSGNWIYPSEQMFFEAMRRKNHDPQAEDMRSIVPIHNAVNERAWGEILEWEKGMGAER
jgi:cytochrome c heme-lyase